MEFYAMIYQLYFSPEHTSRLFGHVPYVGLGIDPAANPWLLEWCPELADSSVRDLLREYKGMLYVWRRMRGDASDCGGDDEWVGFTSYRQTDKRPTQFMPDDVGVIERCLKTSDVLGWGTYSFRRETLAMQAERCHPRFDQLLSHLPIEIPADWYSHTSSCLYCNYWIMSLKQFGTYMSWAHPLIEWMLRNRGEHPILTRLDEGGVPFLSAVMERLVILWAMRYDKRVKDVTNGFAAEADVETTG